MILWWICKLIRLKHQQISPRSVNDIHMTGLWLAFTGKHKIQKQGEYKWVEQENEWEGGDGQHDTGRIQAGERERGREWESNDGVNLSVSM